MQAEILCLNEHQQKGNVACGLYPKGSFTSLPLQLNPLPHLQHETSYISKLTQKSTYIYMHK